MDWKNGYLSEELILERRGWNPISIENFWKCPLFWKSIGQNVRIFIFGFKTPIKKLKIDKKKVKFKLWENTNFFCFRRKNNEKKLVFFVKFKREKEENFWSADQNYFSTFWTLSDGLFPKSNSRDFSNWTIFFPQQLSQRKKNERKQIFSNIMKLWRDFYVYEKESLLSDEWNYWFGYKIQV